MPSKSKRSYEFSPPASIQDDDILELATFAGSKYQLAGLAFSGNGQYFFAQFPDECRSMNAYTLLCPTWEEFSEILRQSNDPVIQLHKSFVRKSQYVISGMAQQQVWVRDGFRCAYCGVEMGKALMTIDHFVPLELNGLNDQSNYLSCCRRDNKDKGNMRPEEWCKAKRLDYHQYVEYLAGRTVGFTLPFPQPPF